MNLGPRYDVFLVKDQWDIISHLALHWHPLKDSFSKYFAVLDKEPLKEYKGRLLITFISIQLILIK